jgi:hypothetical protein
VMRAARWFCACNAQLRMCRPLVVVMKSVVCGEMVLRVQRTTTDVLTARCCDEM